MKNLFRICTLLFIAAVLVGCHGHPYRHNTYGHGTGYQNGYYGNQNRARANINVRARGSVLLYGGHSYHTVPCEEVLAFMQATQGLRDWAKNGNGAEVRNVDTYANNYSAGCSASASANSVMIGGKVFPIDPRYRNQFGNWRRNQFRHHP